MKTFLIPAALIALAITGCSKPKPSLERIHTGMNEDQVYAILGKPSTTAQQGSAKFLEYESYDRDIWLGSGRKENGQIFFIRLIDGRVESFGRKGDFDSTKNPTQEIKIDKKVEMTGTSTSTAHQIPAPFDLQSELLKLEQMK